MEGREALIDRPFMFEDERACMCGQ